MNQHPFDATTPLRITLQLQEWNQVLAVLSEAPYKLVAPLISQITQQAQQAHVQGSALSSLATNGLPNGSTKVHPAQV